MGEYSTEIPMITEEDVRDNAGPAQVSFENAHLKKWVNSCSRHFRADLDGAVDAHPTALASEKVDMKRLNKKVAHLSKHSVFAADLIRRCDGWIRMQKITALYDQAGFGELSRMAHAHVEDLTGLKMHYGRIFVDNARRYFGEKECFIADRAASAQRDDLRYQDKIKHRKLHGRSVKSPDPSSSEDEREWGEDLGSLKSSVRVF
jgi:hypothetical protein